jgi:hypothetical protein
MHAEDIHTYFTGAFIMNPATLAPLTAEQVLGLLHLEYLAADAENDRKSKLKILPLMVKMSLQLHKDQQTQQKKAQREKQGEDKDMDETLRTLDRMVTELMKDDKPLEKKQRVKGPMLMPWRPRQAQQIQIMKIGKKIH